VLTILDGNRFLVCDDLGDVEGGVDGLYSDDTRHLSRWVMRVNGRRPKLLSSGLRDHASAVIYAQHDVGTPSQPSPLATVRELFVSAGALLEPGSPFYVASPAGPMGSVFRGALESAGWRFHQCLVWVKDAFVLGHSDHHFRHEDILYGHLPGEGRPGRGRHQGSRWRGDNAQDTVFEVARPKRSETHPTMKPVELITAQLRNSIRPGEIVLDPFAGSGSTMIAAETLGARAFLVEIDAAYCDVIRQRYADYTGRPEFAP